MTYDQNKNFPVSWEELHRTSKALAWRLLELGPFTGIIAVTRGGLVPAAIVARELEVRLIETACLASYQAQERGEVEVMKAPEMAKIIKACGAATRIQIEGYGGSGSPEP